MPGGSYAYVKSWLDKNSENELTVPKGTIQAVFDNEHAVGKRYNVSLDNSSVPISIITSHAYL